MRTESTPKRRTLPVTLILFGVTCLLFAGMAMAQIDVARRFGGFLYVARHLEMNETFPPGVVADYAKRSAEIVNGNYCRSDVVRAGLTVTLARLDELNAANDSLNLRDSLAIADYYLQHAIGCIPTDGNLWVRLAMVEMSLGAQPARIASLMTQAAWLAPAEMDVIIARFAVWNMATPRTLELAEDALETDLSTLATRTDAYTTARMLKNLSAALLPRVKQALSQMPEERRKLLTSNGLDPALLR